MCQWSMYCLSVPDPPSATCSRVGEGPCKYFSFSIRQDVMPGEGKEGSALFPRLLCYEWPVPCQAPVACSGPWHPGPNSTSLRGFPVSSKVALMLLILRSQFDNCWLKVRRTYQNGQVSDITNSCWYAVAI